MPQCTVCVYDETMSPADGSSIEIQGRDHFGTNIDNAKLAQSLGPDEFGAKIDLPDPPEPIVIWVDDNLGRLAPTTLGHLNGKMTARLDVILYSLPSPPGGGGLQGRLGVQTGQAAGVYAAGSWLDSADVNKQLEEEHSPGWISNFISQRVASDHWTESEATGVRSLVETVVRARNAPRPSEQLQTGLERWCSQLKGLGINISAYADVVAKNAEKETGQGGAQMMQASS